MTATASNPFLAMAFPERLATLRNERGMTHQALADQVVVKAGVEARRNPIGGARQ